MRKKNPSLGFRPTGKVAHYMSQLGLLDLTTGRKPRSSVGNANKFINFCIACTLESGYFPESTTIDSDELMRAWARYRVAMNNREIEHLQEMNIRLASQTPIAKAHKQAMEQLME